MYHNQASNKQYVAKGELLPNGDSLKRIAYILDALLLPRGYMYC